MEKKFIEKYLKFQNEPKKRYPHPFIVTFSGYSGSGKSLLSKILSKELGLYIISGDYFRHQIYDDPAFSHDFDDVEQIINHICEEKITKLLEHNIAVMLDRSVSSLEVLDKLNKYHVPIILIELISDHEHNIKRVTHRKEGRKRNIEAYGDVDTASDVTTREMYNEIKDRKVYDLPKERFDYQIDARGSLEEEIKEILKVAKEIKKKIEG